MGVALEASREEVEKMKNLLLLCRGTHSFSQQLKTLLARVDQFLEHVEVTCPYWGPRYMLMCAYSVCSCHNKFSAKGWVGQLNW